MVCSAGQAKVPSECVFCFVNCDLNLGFVASTQSIYCHDVLITLSVFFFQDESISVKFCVQIDKNLEEKCWL